MKQLDEFPSGSDNRHRYDWARLLDGGVYEMKRGEDFHASAASFRTYAYSAALKRGKSVRARIVDADTVVLQAVRER